MCPLYGHCAGNLSSSSSLSLLRLLFTPLEHRDAPPLNGGWLPAILGLLDFHQSPPSLDGFLIWRRKRLSPSFASPIHPIILNETKTSEAFFRLHSFLFRLVLLLFLPVYPDGVFMLATGTYHRMLPFDTFDT